MKQRWVWTAVLSALAWAIWGLAAHNGYGWQMLWLPGVVTGAAWPRDQRSGKHDRTGACWPFSRGE
jgi:hypothetical protein